MRKMFMSLFLLCMCALSFVASAEVVIDQSCQHELASVDALHAAPELTAEAVGVGVNALNNHEYQELSLIATESVSGNLESGAPERYDKAFAFA